MQDWNQNVSTNDGGVHASSISQWFEVSVEAVIDIAFQFAEQYLG